MNLRLTYLSSLAYRVFFVAIAFYLDRVMIERFGLEESSWYFILMSFILAVSLVSRFGVESFILVENINSTPIINAYIVLSSISVVSVGSGYVLLAPFFSDKEATISVTFILTTIFLNLSFILGLVNQLSGRVFLAYLSQFNLFYVIVLAVVLVVFMFGIDIEVSMISYTLLISAIACFFLIVKSSKLDVTDLTCNFDFWFKNFGRYSYFFLATVFQVLQIRSIVFFSTLWFAESDVVAIAVAIKIGLGISIISGVVNFILIPRIKAVIQDRAFEELYFLLLGSAAYIIVVNCFFYHYVEYVLMFFSGGLDGYSDFVLLIVLAQTVATLWNVFAAIIIGISPRMFCVATGLGTLLLLVIVYLFGSIDMAFLAWGLLAGYLFQIAISLVYLLKNSVGFCR